MSQSEIYPRDDDPSDLDSCVSDAESHETISSTGCNSTVSVASADVASTSRSNLSSFGYSYSVHETSCDAVERFIPEYSATRSSLSLSVDLLGLPSVHRAQDSDERDGRFLDNESLRYFGVDLSYLSQPDGRNSWTLGLGVPPLPRDPSSSDDPSSHSTLSPLAAVSSVENESMTSVGTCHPAEEDATLDCQPWEPTNGRPPYSMTQSSDRNSQRFIQAIGVRYAPTNDVGCTPTPKGSSRPRQVFKGILGDVKKLGQRVKDQILKTHSRRPSGVSFSSERPSMTMSATEPLYPPSTEYARYSADTCRVTNLEFANSRVYPRAGIDAVSNRHSMHPRPPTPSTGLTFSKVNSLDIKEIKSIRRRTLPSSIENAQEPLPPSAPFERRPRPSSLVIMSGVDSRYDELRHLDTIQGSPVFSFGSNYGSRVHRLSNDFGYWSSHEHPAELRPKKPRWSSFSFLSKSSKR
ncbi:hypothetical protein CC1G_06747 [Coprinopsis cinerea okayama7|uniref:Uncharacterized protein n=1 Tax=Coprinopsis cinerea (strain Okayama-7 / 130 / ATCC MYA-4618 / FGSC 9003) TaxID=240176 RepID=A8N1I1_COPC7|nr:hypothetical protein CC1G_06747 [Coprinopsis cinerea okayama7\|eukprot:XP_001828761.2 hypothetical protein CC1G_06747 [Coprinopsis cinerea okayama7\